MTVDSPKTIPFLLVNAFSNDPSGGNPVAIVFLQEELPEDTLQVIAKNLNQPMAMYIYPPSPQDEHEGSKTNSKSFRVRWFSPICELPLCGHATLAAAGAMFADPSLVPAGVDALTFQSAKGRVLTAKRVGDMVEISLEATTTTQTPPAEEERLKAIVRRGLGKDDVTIRYIGTGGTGFEGYVMVEIDEQDDLEGCQINHGAFAETGHRINIITSASSKANIAFVSRMFAPTAGVMEDHVCGSAHCLLVPYWTKKLGKEPVEFLSAKQVSARGGDLVVSWKETQKLITLRGETKCTAKGELWL